MLSIDGHISFASLTNRCAFFIQYYFGTWERELESRNILTIDEEKYLMQKPDRGRHHDFLITNINGATRWLAKSLAYRANSYILTSAGIRVQVSPRYFDAGYGLNREAEASTLKELGIRGRDILPSIFIKSNWQLSFSEKELFIDKRFDTHLFPEKKLLHWETGSIDICHLDAQQERRRVWDQRTRERIAAGDPRITDSRRIQKTHPIYDKGEIAVFKPYHGCPIIVPDTCLEYLEISDDDVRSDYSRGTPSEQIIDYYGDNPQATKSKIKAALFPSMSAREFSRHIAIAADKVPEISKPGRRPKQD